MTNNRTPAPTSSRVQIDAFLTGIKTLAPKSNRRGQLIFALDATASRQPTWDTACRLQADMFREAAAIGELDVQLVYYRGLNEFQASKWVSQPEQLTGLMERTDCRSGHTQLGKVLAHAKRETELLKVQALVFVGDAMEENPDDLAQDAAALGRAGVPAFMFQEGNNREVERVFREIARLNSWRLFPLRYRRSTRTGRASACRGGLCRRRDDRACRSPRRGRSQAA